MSHNTYHQGNDPIYPLPIHNFFDKMELCKDYILEKEMQYLFFFASIIYYFFPA